MSVSNRFNSESDRDLFYPSSAPRKFRFRIILILLVLAAALIVWFESKTSALQAHFLSSYADTLTYELKPGENESVRYPEDGPFDIRLGYSKLPNYLEKLKSNGFQIDAQVEMSQPLLAYLDLGLNIPYQEKTNAGLVIRDRQERVIYQFRYPQWAYSRFDDIPEIVWQTLLFIEDREVLNNEYPYRNPAIDWARFMKAAIFKAGEYISIDTPSMGGSTLATQIEKFRHSDEGRTSSITDKLRQMASASVRIYQQGEDTFAARQRLVLDYLNTVPLAAAPGYGEVNGLGDGLKVWFNTDASEANRLLKLTELDGEELQQQGLALRQVIALMIAHRRPSEFLYKARTELEELTESYVRLLAREGYISHELRNAALATSLSFRRFDTHPASTPIPTNKGVNFARGRLRGLLATSLYDLDRMDLSIKSSLQADLQEEVSKHLTQLRDPDFAKANGLVGEYLLQSGQAANLRYSFTLFEKTDEANRIRVQTDNTDQPFDINEGSKLELGSTAKVRVLATYLEIIAEVWQHYQLAEPMDLRSELNNASDPLTLWTINRMLQTPGIELPELLQEALFKTYSASPAERFFTGGGSHTFGNFKKEDNSKVPTVLESLQQSINLPFVRMLRDIVNYTNANSVLNKKDILANDNDPRRAELLDRFIDRESQQFMTRFWRKYQKRSAEERLEAFLSGLKLTPGRLAVIHRYLFPDSDVQRFSAFLKQQLPTHPWTEKEINRLYDQYGRDKHNLQDQGYLARVHPLELWLLGYLAEQEVTEMARPINLQQILADSVVQRREIYSWLMKTKAKNKRDIRIRSALEVEAFSEIHRRWKKLGYPFDHLVPSLATALGSSGDRPAALTELMGIIQNQGRRLPVYRIESMIFGKDTPYETHLSQQAKEAEQVMEPAVAETLRFALSTVVQDGTGRRIKDVFKQLDGKGLMIGGKTGTGDNRLVSVGPGGQRVKTRSLSRTATFVFYLGEHHFGTLTAFVPGDSASNYSFTSALPVQVLKSMAPLIQPHLELTAKEHAEKQARIQAELEDERARQTESALQAASLTMEAVDLNSANSENALPRVDMRELETPEESLDKDSAEPIEEMPVDLEPVPESGLSYESNEILEIEVEEADASEPIMPPLDTDDSLEQTDNLQP